MYTTAFGVEDDIFKAAPGLRSAAKIAGKLRPVGNVRGAGMRSPGAVSDLLRPGAVPTMADKVRAVGTKIKNADYRPIAGPVGARRITPAGVGYAAGGGGLAAGLAARGGNNKQPVAKSAFGVEDDRISKADDDQPGKDHKKLKYTAAGATGYVAGSQAGSRIGARTAGTRLKTVNRGVQGVMQNNLMPGGQPRNAREALSGLKHVYAEGMRVPGARAATRGGLIGAATGTAAGLGAYAAHRRNRG